MTKVMGIEPPIDIKTSVIEMAYSLLEKGLIKKPKRVLQKEKKKKEATKCKEATIKEEKD